MTVTDTHPIRQSISLAGTWGFRLDPAGVGSRLSQFESDGEGITLPGSTDEQGKGYANSRREQHYLSRIYEYIGPAWYRREIMIPEGWQGKRILLFLERPHWETTVWLDQQFAGCQNSLCTPHVYELGQPAPGGHTLTIRVDNTPKIGVGDAIAKDGHFNMAHSITEHTQTNWNGIIGRVELQATDLVWVEDLQVYPDPESDTARVVLKLGNATGEAVSGHLTLAATRQDASTPEGFPDTTVNFGFETEQTVVETDYTMRGMRRWDEFTPTLYRLTAELGASSASGNYRDQNQTRFGMRNFTTQGRQFQLNDKPVFLRGTLECCIFPLTGYPPMDIDAWRRVLEVARAHGLNHLRFHSWCPPEAAFVAADDIGFIFQIEGPLWAEFGSDPAIDDFAYAEGDRILRVYGNHPSFCLLAVTNEPSGENKEAFFARILEHWHSQDSRRVYTSGSGWPTIPENDFHSTPTPRSYRWGEGLEARFNAESLTTDVDYTDFIQQYDVPVVSHEIGEWTTYPDYRQISKYTGVLKPRNLEHFRDSLVAHGLLDKAEAFAIASGKLQTLLYKEEIEAALRTPEFGGFQLLDLHDFPGQGTALVGVLDAFWDSKGYVTAEEFREFCAETVLLARMPKVVWQQHETFEASIQIAHFGHESFEDMTVTWALEYADGRTVKAGALTSLDIALGSGISLGKVSISLEGVQTPSHLVFRLALEGTPFRNHWDLWIYPTQLDMPSDVLVAERLDEVGLARLRRGGSVLLLPPADVINNDIPLGFTTPFWNTAFTEGQPPHTMGLLCNPKHPALASFPTQSHSNWQWWEVVHGAKCLQLDELPAIEPVIHVIDDWTTNRKLALAFEAQVEGGRLLVCSADLRSRLEWRPVARQLRHSLLTYMQSSSFAPATQLELSALRRLGDLATTVGPYVR